MIEKSLTNLTLILDELLSLTKDDIAAIKAAKHGGVMASVERKNELVEKFQKEKSTLYDALLSQSDGGTRKIDDLLSKDGLEKLAEFKIKMKELQSLNKEYAKLVLVVKNYFDGLINSAFDKSGSEYGKENSPKDDNFKSLFKINV